MTAELCLLHIAYFLRMLYVLRQGEMGVAIMSGVKNGVGVGNRAEEIQQYEIAATNRSLTLPQIVLHHCWNASLVSVLCFAWC
jgi:hypothetical protein